MVVPDSLPLWEAIADDVWAIGRASSQPEVQPGWTPRSPLGWSTVWSRMGKPLDSMLERKFKVITLIRTGTGLEQSGEALLARRILVGVVDRLVGKHGFTKPARLCILHEVHIRADVFLAVNTSGSRRDFVVLPDVVWVELAVAIAAMLLSFCSLNLSADWSSRFTCTDSSMTRISRA